MIPNEDQCKALWDKYQLSERKRKHVELVARMATTLATKVKSRAVAKAAMVRRRQKSKVKIDEKLLMAGALLHDIDKNIPRLPGEQHPDTGVRILREEGMEEVAELVRTHPLHAILDPAICPKTLEEKLLFLADKMVKDDVIGVDARFKLWNDEHLPTEEQAILDAAYPKVKELEREVLGIIRVKPEEIVELVKHPVLSV